MGLPGVKQRRKTGNLWSVTDPKSPPACAGLKNRPVVTRETKWERNLQLNGVEIQFSRNPPGEVKALIQLHGFRLARDRKIGRIFWWARATPERLAVAEKAVSMFKESE